MDELRSPSLPTSPAASIIVFPLPSTLFVLQLLGTIRCPEKPQAAHEPATEALPARVSIALNGAVPDARGILHMTLDCMTLDELESCINDLQDELDVLRAEARRIFASNTGYA